MDFLKKYPIVAYGGLLLGVLAVLALSDILSTRFDYPERASYRSFTLWNEMWSSPDGSLRRKYSEPPDERLTQIIEEILALGHEKGFKFTDPRFRQTTAEYHTTVSIARDMIYGDPAMGHAYPGSNRILVSSAYVALMTDDEVRVLVAHEIGHNVDAQSERMDDERLVEWRRLPHQVLADRFAAELLSQELVEAFNLEWVGYRREPRGEEEEDMS